MRKIIGLVGGLNSNPILAASTALVGTPEIVAESILDYVKLGADLISIRGYDNLGDAIDYGRFILPKVREGIKELPTGKP